MLVDLEEGSYVGPILTGPLTDLLVGCRTSGGGGNDDGGSGSGIRGGNGNGGSRSSGGSGGTELKTKKVGAHGGGAWVRVRYDAHLLTLSLWDGKNT